MSEVETHEEETTESEFGSGIVVCLAKFSEHLSNHMYERVSRAIWWSEASEEKREAQRKEANIYPHGDAAQRIRDAESALRVGETPEQAISESIMMWMNGASDHMYGVDRDVAPPALVALADLTLAVGHGFTEIVWTKETVEKIRQLWQDACLEVDALLGVKADWGQW